MFFLEKKYRLAFRVAYLPFAIMITKLKENHETMSLKFPAIQP